MDGVSWSTPGGPESFKRPPTASDTLNRLASFIARAETKQSTRTNKQQALPLPCLECGETFQFVTDLLEHQEVQHTLPKPHRCPSCGKEFSLRSSLQLHKCEDSSPPQMFHGETCNGPAYATCLTNVSDAERPIDGPHCQPHMLDSSPYACAPCGKGFNHKQALLHHQQALCSKTMSPPCTHNPSSTSFDSQSVFEEESFSNSLEALEPCSTTDNVCIFCSRTFHNEADFQRHKEKSHHSDEQQTDSCSLFDELEAITGEGSKGSPSKKKVFNCRSCEMVFGSTAKLYVHRKEKHSRGISIRTEPGPVSTKHRRGSTYTCQICSKVFFHHLSLWAHSRKHPTLSANKDKGLPAKETGKGYKSLQKPNTEKKSVPNKMSVRGSPWPKTVSLDKHHRKLLKCKVVPDEEEDEEVEFPCPSCPEVFSLHSELTKHIELHQTAVRRCRCSVCANEMDSCKWPGSKKHRLYHCVPCQQGFSSLDSFLTHCQDHLRVKVDEEGLTGSTRLES